MNTIITSKIIITMLIPMITGLLVMSSGKKPNLRDSWSTLGAILTFVSVLSFIPSIMDGNQLKYTLFELYPGVSVMLNLDGLGVISLWLRHFYGYWRVCTVSAICVDLTSMRRHVFMCA